MIRFITVCIFLIQICLAQSKFVNTAIRVIYNTEAIQDSAYRLAQTIDTPELKRVLYYLASDSCQGRELGTPGNDRASNFISAQLKSYGIPSVFQDSSYFQKVDFNWVSWAENNITVDDFEYRQIWDYVSIATENESLNLQTDSLIFLGYGIDAPNYSDYSGIQTEGKVIVIYNGEPKNKSGIHYTNGKTDLSIWSTLDQKLKAAKKHHVKCVFIVEEKFRELADQHRSSLYSPTVVLNNKAKTNPFYVNTVYISSTMFSKILGSNQKKIIAAREKINKKGRPKAVYLKLNLHINQSLEVKNIRGKNILAYIEGTDKKEELLIITAHYDHIGMRGQDVFNGADDNGSGSSGLLQIAKAFQDAKNHGFKPRRSILCMFVTGEEKGLLGSMYYVNDPIFPLSSTIADINIDMIGRIDQKYWPLGNYVYVIGSDRLSADLHKTNEEVNRLYSHLTLDYTYNDENDPNRYYYRSDHYNFAERGIPSIFFFSGVHEDYHRITDDPEKIIFSKYKDIVRHVFLLAWRLANMEQRLTINSPQ